MKEKILRIPKPILLIVIAAAAFAMGFVLRFIVVSRPSFAEFTNTVFREELSANTISLHYTLENPKSYGIKKYAISLGAYESGTEEERSEALKKTKLRLLTYPFTSLSLEEQLTYDIFQDYLDVQLEMNSYTLYEEYLSFANGMHTQLPILLAEYEFNSERDVKDYLELLALLDEYYEDIIQFEKDKSAAGLFMSTDLCEKSIDSCEAFLENQEEHYMLVTFENRLDELDLAQSTRDDYIERNEEIFEEQVVPAYEYLIGELRKLQGTGKNTGGLCNFPDGKRYYELLLYAETGCSDSVEDIYRRIEEQRALDILICADLEEQDPTIYDRASSIEWELEGEESILDRLQQQMLKDFPEAPDTEYTISFVDPALQEYLAPAFYIVAPLDNYRENTIFINDANTGSDIYYFTTLAHEGFPGHLYQTVMSYEYDMMPIRSILDYSGYVEGWATYIEMMSYYYSGLDEDIATLLSRNQSATLSLYASSDIGIHYLGWTQNDMYEFWATYGITDREVVDGITELILAEPGNYLKYYVGYLEILDLQKYAKETFGRKYDVVEFHRTLLDICPAPFDIIETYFEPYYNIEEK